MRLLIPKAPLSRRNLKVCLLSAIVAVIIFVLDEQIMSTPGIHRSLKPSSPDVLVYYRLSSPDVNLSFKPSSLDLPEFFKPQVTYEEFRVMQDLVRTFSEAMRNASLTFFLTMGSLLGSWRHHGLVPWDDDVDLGILSQESESVSTVLGNLTPHYFLALGTPRRWKFYSSRGQPAGQDSWNWPYVDISLYDQNSDSVWDPTDPASSYPIDDVFPLRNRPYMGMMLPAPNDTEAVLKHYFQISSLCKPSLYNHSGERWTNVDIDRVAVPCEQLHNVYPFVWRQPAGGGLKGCNESLVIKGSVLSWVVLNTTRC